MHPQDFLTRLAEGGAYASNDGRERLQGLAVLGVTFESGHVLALRHFEHSSSGPGFTAVWMREPNGDWRFFSTNPPERSCAKFMVPAMADQAAVDLEWIDSRTLRVEVPAIRLRWFVEFEESPRTRVLSKLLFRAPAALLRNRGVSRLVSLVARTVLRGGTLRLSGEVPNGQPFRGIPRQLWRVSRSTAGAGMFYFGNVVRPARQEKFGDFYVPVTSLAMGGMVEFSPLPAKLPAGNELAAAA